MFDVALVCVSDTAFADPDSDRVLPLIADTLARAADGVYNVARTAIVPDEPREITRAVEDAIERRVALCLTTGGTGFGTRDNTPEAVAKLIAKPAPGLVTAMLVGSLGITPLAALSRPVAGVAMPSSKPEGESDGRGTLVVTLPGSPKGAKENLDILLPVLAHALELVSGAPSRETRIHRENEQGQRGGGPTPALVDSRAHGEKHLPRPRLDHSCAHGHAAPTPRTTPLVSKDPSISIASRQRHSPWPLVSVDDALELVFEHTPSTEIESARVDHDLVGRVLVDDVYSKVDIPNRPSTNIDGYAVRSSDDPGVYKVVTEFPSEPLAAGSIMRIATGAPLPPGADACVMVEDTEVVSRDASDEEVEVRVLCRVDPGENVRDGGSDVARGDKVLERGQVVTKVGGELGTLAFIGNREVLVRRRPIVAVLSTGNELVDLDQARDSTAAATTAKVGFSSIVDSNRPTLISILRDLHYDVVDLGICGDSVAETTAALKRGTEEADVVVTTGGTSMGVGDLLKPCVERELGGTVHFGRVAMKPGKPTTFATVPPHPMAPSRNEKLVFALPGNPASALVTFYLFVLPSLRKLEGRSRSEWQLARVPVSLTETVKLDSRAEYHRVSVRATRRGLEAVSTGGQRSSRTVSLARANGLLELPPRGEGPEAQAEKRKGDIVSCVLIGDVLVA
ncbi:hypothetical protein JCM3766R1_005895 [Sporobolomyces carnicolor]